MEGPRASLLQVWTAGQRHEQRRRSLTRPHHFRATAWGGVGRAQESVFGGALHVNGLHAFCFLNFASVQTTGPCPRGGHSSKISHQQQQLSEWEDRLALVDVEGSAAGASPSTTQPQGQWVKGSSHCKHVCQAHDSGADHKGMLAGLLVSKRGFKALGMKGQTTLSPVLLHYVLVMQIRRCW